MNFFVQYVFFIGVLLCAAIPLGSYFARVIEGNNRWGRSVLGWFESSVYRLTGIKPESKMSWQGWVIALLVFSVSEIVVLWLLLVFQDYLPLNPQHLPGLSWDLALNTAISFVTNTNWQSYSGETTISYFLQMTGLTVRNFTSAAAGMAVMCALFRAFGNQAASGLGNFWTDMVRIILYVLLPLSVLISVLLLSQGVIQNLLPNLTVTDINGQVQSLPMGPVASQEAIKLLGTNGGGFFNANSAHPFENPTGLSNFIEMLSILLLPASLIFAFGKMVRDMRQSWLIFAVMATLLTVWVGGTFLAEKNPPVLNTVSVDGHSITIDPSAGNMEGKETRFGVFSSVLFANVTTATSCGAVNSMHESLTPLGGLFPLTLMMMGEVVFGGAGSGMYGMLVQILLTVFIAGLMVGRTPEYLGKKIEPFEMIMVSVAALATPIVILLGMMGAICGSGNGGASAAGIAAAFPQGFSELLYAFTSAGNNNGSAFAGFGANTPLLNTLLGVAMFLGRFGVMIPVLALAGSLAPKKKLQPSPGTLPTNGWVFGILLIFIILVVGALNFIPALFLGPVAHALMVIGGTQ